MAKPDKPTRLYLVRHGVTDWNLLGRYQGCRSDICLCDKGRDQAAALGRALADSNMPKPTVVVASPASRARDTAEAVYGNWCGGSPTIHVEEDLREMDFGDWEGLTYGDIVTGYPELHAKWLKAPTDTTPPNGESLMDVMNRAWPCVESIAQRWTGEDVLVVAHGGTLRAALAAALGLPMPNYARLNVGHATVSTLLLYTDAETGNPAAYPYLDLLNWRPWAKG